MIGALPKELTVDGAIYPINSDYRAVLDIMQAFNDPRLSEYNKVMTMLEILYGFIPHNVGEAQKQALWFLDCGQSGGGNQRGQPQTIDWRQDEQLLFAAINAVTKCEIRELPYRHWWTFVGDCKSISPDSLISAIANIRYKLAKGEKLEKYEQKFYNENQELIDIRSQIEERENFIKALRGE